MAAGLPVVASRTGGIPEAVEDGRTGLLVPPGDSVRLSRALGHLIEDSGLARAMGRAGSHRAERFFSAERMIEETLEVYRTLAGT